MSAVTAGLAGRRHAGLGMRRVWAGAILLVLVELLFDLGQTLQQAGEYPRPLPIATAWVVLVVSDVAIIVVTRALGEHLPNWLFTIFLTGLALACALDITATWGFEDMGLGLTATVSAATSLIIAVPTRPGREIVGAAIVLAAGTAAALWLGGGMAPVSLHNAVFTLAQMLLPPIVAVIAVSGLRALARREVDRVLTESAVAAPRLTVGIEASEQLARLDLAAESLLAAVADGRLEVPLTADVAKRAGGLATELRAHLLVSRSKTWLGLAIEESEALRETVAIEDPERIAGLLNTRQRGALLAAIWLIAEEPAYARTAGSPILVEFAAPVRSGESDGLRAVPIRLTIPRFTRTTVDPGVWERIAQVGRYQEASAPDGLRIDIRCLIAVPGSAAAR
jgi:hypothetical protein